MQLPLYMQVTGLSAAKTLSSGVSTVTAHAIAAAGSGYHQGDIVTVSGGTALIAKRYLVTAVTFAGAVVAVSPMPEHGLYTAKPSNAVSTTVSPSGGTGLTLTLTFTDNYLPLEYDRLLLQAETQNVRWRDDGTAPTASVGMLLIAGAAPTWYDLSRVKNLQFIEAVATAKLNVSFY